MKINKQLWKICMDIYKELYKNAQPPANFKKLIKSGETKKHNWFMNYYLSDKEMNQIINKHTKKHKLGKRDKKVVHFEVWLGCSPTSNKKRWKKEGKITVSIRSIIPNDKLKQTYRKINLDGTKGMQRGVK